MTQNHPETWPGTRGEDLVAEFDAAPYGAWFSPEDFVSAGVPLRNPEQFTGRSTEDIGYIRHDPCGSILKVIIIESPVAIAKSLNAHLDKCSAVHPVAIAE